VGPFLVFMVLQTLVGLVKVENPLLPWWRAGPEHWVYPLQTMVCLGLVAFWWKHYSFRPLGRREWTLAILVGLVGICLWIIPVEISTRYGIDNAWSKWLGVTSRSKPGYDPTLLAGTPLAYGAVTMRFVRMVVAVAVLEELFMRGFLWRYLAHPEGDFQKVPIGVWSVRGIVGSIVLFTLGHGVPDLLACFVYGVLISWLAWKTRSLGACVVCHGVSNLVLGIYVMQTHQWGFW
jgi:CAAX prenyl protease-like protein